MQKLIDLSHALRHGMVTYKGLPAPLICDYLSREDSRSHYAAGTEFQIGRIDMVANTGTYVDAPFHRYATGKDLAELALQSLANLPGIVVRIVNAGPIGPEHFHGQELSGKAVLVHTGWSRHWGEEQYFSGHPYLTAAAAELLREAGAALVGIDSLNIDDTRDGERPVHSCLLGADIPIVEHLCELHRLPAAGFRFHAAPVKVCGMGTFPVRAYAVVDVLGESATS